MKTIVEFPNWSKFTEVINTRFGPMEYEDYAESLAKLKQTGSLRDYQKEFEKLSNHVTGLPESFLVSWLIGGLKDEIRVEVKMFKPTSLMAAIGLARLEEEWTSIKKQPSKSIFAKPASATIPPVVTPQPIKRISPEEAEERRQKKLCYGCD